MEALRDKLKWFMGIRVAVVTLTLGVLIYFQIGKSTQAIPAYYGLIVGTYFLTLPYGLLVNRIDWLPPVRAVHAHPHICVQRRPWGPTRGAEGPSSPRSLPGCQ